MDYTWLFLGNFSRKREEFAFETVVEVGGHFSGVKDLVCLYSHMGVCFIFVKIDIYNECTSVYFILWYKCI